MPETFIGPKKIKVLSIISRMNIGGPAVLLAELINNTPFEEFEHILATGRCEPNEVDYLESHSLVSKVIYIKWMSRTIFPLKDLFALFTLTKLIRKIRPDIIHTHTSKAGLLGRLSAFFSGTNPQIIHTYHGHLLYGYFSTIRVRFFVFIEKVLAKKTFALIAVTNQVRDDLFSAGIGTLEQWKVIRPGVSEMELIPSLIARKHLGLRPEDFVIAWIGRFTDIKDPMLAIRTIEKINERSRIKLVMGGNGELYELCTEYVKMAGLPVTFLGWSDNINLVLSASNILLMTSRNEGLPVVIVEAGQFSIPTVSTDVGGVRDFVQNEKTGFLVARKPEEIAEVILRLMNNPDLLVEMGEGAHRVSKSGFDAFQYISRHLDLYRNCLNLNR